MYQGGEPKKFIKEMESDGVHVFIVIFILYYIFMYFKFCHEIPKGGDCKCNML